MRLGKENLMVGWEKKAKGKVGRRRLNGRMGAEDKREWKVFRRRLDGML